MKISLGLFIYLLHGINCMKTSLNLMKYLDDRAKIVGEELIRHARKPENFYTVKLHEVDNVKLIGNYSSGEILTFFNNPYVVLDREMYKISRSNYTAVEKFLPNEKSNLWKSITFKHTGFMMFSTNENLLHIYGFHNETFFKIQNIVQVNITDAIFFESQNDLYLIVSSYKSYDLTSVIVYKFIESHFDETEKFLTSGALKLHTFGNNGSEIIVILQKSGVGTSLYEFKHDKIKKIHKIDTKNSDEVLSYSHFGKQHVIFFSTQNVYLYFWTGSDLLFLEQFASEFPLTGTKSIFYVNANPYLIVSFDTHFLIFSLTNNKFLQIHNSVVSADWTNILTFKISQNVLLALGKVDQNRVEIKSVSISIEEHFLPEKIVEDEKLSNCFLNLEKSIYFLRNKITEVENRSSLLRESANSDSTTNEFPLKKWKDFQTQYSTVKSVVEGRKKKILIINKPAVVTLSKVAKKLIGEDIRFSTLNNQTWRPEKWLSYTRPQTIGGPVKIKHLKTDNLKTNYHEPLLSDLMLSKKNSIFSGFLKVKNFKAHQLETNSLNNISMSNFYYKSQPVDIKGLKSFPNLEANGLNVVNMNGEDATTVVTLLSSPNFSPSNNLTIQNLRVDNINGVNFDKLKESVFRIGLVETIKGNLTFHNLKAKEMSFETLSKMSNVLTTSTNQNIRSSINITKIFANNVTTNRINNIDFKNSAATLDDKIIEGPVSLKNLYVENNLELKGDIDKEFLLFNNTHIVGTNESDFLQRYHGNVTIKGNLILNNFNLARSAKIFVAGKEFDPKMNQYWTKSTPQTIPTHFEAPNGMSTPHLYTNTINQVKVEDYMVNSTQQNKTGRFYFDSAVVLGNIFLDPEQQHSPDLVTIEKESVKTNGTFRIKGHKTYVQTLKVDTLEVGNLEGANDLFSNNDSMDLGPKKIVNMVIKGDLNLKKLSVEEINNVNIKNLTEKAVYIDKPQNVSELHFHNITVENLFITSTLNGNNISQVMANVKNIQETKKINVVYVNNNVTIKNARNLSKINDQKVTQLLQNSRTLYYNDTIFAPTKFLGTVKVRDLHILRVNNVNLQNLSRRILYKSWNQPISQRYTFTKLTTTNLITQKINEFNVKNVIDISKSEPQNIPARHGLKMAKHVKIQNLKGNFGCPLHDSIKNLHSPVTQFWDTVVVTGNATFLDKEGLMSRIFAEVVTQEKSNPVIKGKVRFAGHISVNNITALKKINGIDIMEIIEDAFLNRPDMEQIVTGKKTFTQLEAETLVCLQNTNVTAINGIKIAEIDSKIVSKNAIPDAPIRGHKVFFGGLQTKQIQTESILGVQVNNLVSFQNPKKIPNAMFESVEVLDNFNITFINRMPFEVFLNERLLRTGTPQQLTGNYFFRNVTFKGNITTPQINDIQMENVVFDVGTQVITSPKKFKSNLTVIGNLTTDLINGLYLSKSYEEAVLKNEETNFTGVVEITKPVFTEGSIQTKYINTVPVEYMLDTSAKYSVQVEAQKIHEITEILAGFVKKYMNTTRRMPSEILYLEKIVDLQIPLANAVSAHVVETKDTILIHVESEEDGDFCGLGPSCKCPMQQTMEISSQNSYNVFMNKAMQRIYSYYSDDIIINVITHSVSSSSECRTSTTKVMNEGSTLTWTVSPQKNNSGGFFAHQFFFTGFITGVEFFTIYGKTYVIIGTYYDPVLDTHNVDTLVLRFNEDKTAVEEIQKIPTEGMKMISLFPTAQGFILIMGNEKEKFNNNTSTRILRFNQQKQQFEILREVVTFGAAFAQGVVLGRESLIIFANKHSDLLVLKYHAVFDNYYLYQTFQLGDPVSSLAVFYSEGFGISDAYLSVVTTNHEYFIYSFWFIEGWKLEFSGELEEANILVPFKIKGKLYLFAPSKKTSSLLTLVKHDSD